MVFGRIGMQLFALGLALALALLAACAGTTVESTWASNGAKTASFDLQCPEEKIEVTILVRNDGLGCFGSRVGARGCGRQTTYECNNAREWHRSSEVQAVAAPARP